jgi:hypothetical protein
MSCLKKLYPKAWQKAILEFEKEHLVLTYCSGNWKAEQILGNIIRGRKKPVSDKNGTSTLKRKRGLSTGSPKQASKKQEKKGSENSPDDTGTSHKNEADDEHTTSQTSLVCQCE